MRQPLKLLKSLFDIRTQEFKRVFLMSAYLLLIIACYTTTKAVRDSLFVTQIGPSQLPYVYLLIAGAMGVVSYVYSRVILRIGLYALVQATSVLAISNLLFFWWVLRHDPAGWFYVLYVWVSLFGAITASEAWLVATHVFNPREARRIFAWIGAGGILGGIAGGTLTRIVAPWLGTEALLLFSAGLMSLTILLLHQLAQTSQLKAHEQTSGQTRSREAEGNGSKVFQFVRQSPHLSLLVLLLGLGVVVQAFVDYQFKVVANESFGAKDQLTAFLGTLATYVGFFSLLFQLFLTSRILKRFGVGSGIMLLPIGLLAASIMLAVRPSLFAAATLQVIDGALGYSIHRSSMELLYLPVPSNVRNSVKGFIDTFVDRFGRAIGGLLLLLLTSILALSISSLSLVACVLLLAWIAVGFKVKREYLHSFRLALEKKTIEPEALYTQCLDSATIRALLEALTSADERQVLYALDLLGDTHPSRWRRHLNLLIRHPSSTVRARAITLLAQWDDPTTAPLVNECLQDPDLSVRAEAIHYLYRQDAQPAIRLMEFLNHEDHAIVHAAVHCMSKHQLGGNNHIAKGLVEGALNTKGERGIAARIAAASALNLVWTRSARLRRYLDRLLADSSPEVAREAIQTTASVRYEGAIPALIGKLADSRLRGDAREALLKFPNEVIPELGRRLSSDAEPVRVRARIPKVLAYTGKQESADILLGSLRRVPANLDLAVMKALNRMRLDFPAVTFDRDGVLDLIRRERAEYRQIQMMFNWLRLNAIDPDGQHDPKGAGAVLLILMRTMRERLHRKLDTIFRLLALSHPPHDIYSAYYICTTKRGLRSSAVEFLDNLLDAEFKPLVIPLIEEPIGALSKKETGSRKVMSLNGILQTLMRGKDPWLQTIAADLDGRFRNDRKQRINMK